MVKKGFNSEIDAPIMCVWFDRGANELGLWLLDTRIHAGNCLSKVLPIRVSRR